MTKVIKNGVVMAVRDGNQLSAFFNNGWRILEDAPAETEKEPLPFSDNDITFDEKSQAYTKTDIMRMSKVELQETAKNAGVEGADDMTGTELKERLLNVLKL